MPGRTRPIEKFAEATAKCTAEVSSVPQKPGASNQLTYLPKGAVYGKCVASNFQNVSKDMCVKEFMALKDCYVKAAGRKA
ncbi:hypothetical protein D0867_00402 [Hortaea werneckii]|uniref:IMS import disulfide relay-system CHCH-CHCH-like Cx9C domain-containing protein n=1 Tax=Hortaea werneckii TaxID=91943 RepID=A0A3M7AEH5_HORWE|nr:hypothetical protein D0868_00372 [Hortaea werneckii]RMY25925.1 hypothetical protein D0867_00402 [Hortaea werneckii]RMY56314.1 hypothetical protein D0865_03716 [Hortaea werneckii]